jgi:hypothetical protein
MARLMSNFLLASGITITQNYYIQGLYYTSSTFGSATLNLLPVFFTFAMATLIRLESFNIRTLGGHAKILGTVIFVGGAMIMTLYKGPALKFLSPGAESHLIASNLKPNNLVLGSILVFASIVSWSSCIVFFFFFFSGTCSEEVSGSAIIDNNRVSFWIITVWSNFHNLGT